MKLNFCVNTTWVHCICALALLGCNPVTKQEENQSPTKNILVIISDDHAAHALGALGNPQINTPNLDRLAGEGMFFTRAYCNSPLCSASRQSLLTGKYPHATGVTLLTTSFPDSGNITLAEHLRGYGYATGLFGKSHFNNDGHHGFDTFIDRADYRKWVTTQEKKTLPDSIKVRPAWKPFRDHARVWLNAEGATSGYSIEQDEGRYLARQCISFMATHRDSPFLAWLAFYEPHSPFNFPAEFQARYEPELMPLPESSPEDEQWIPKVFGDLTRQEKQGIIASYYTSVSYMDSNVGVVLDALDSLELAEKTWVVYLGDHGYLLDHHRRFEKHMMWEPAVRAPLIVRGMENTGPSNAMVEFVDIVPTVLEALHVPPLEEVQGRSFMSVLLGEDSTFRKAVFSEFLADNKIMIRTDRWKYIYTTGKHDLAQGYATGNPPPGVTHRLYDQKNDPDEWKNVADDPAYAGVLKRMKEQAVARFMETDPRASDLPAGLSLDEQLAWFCEPPEEDANWKAI